MDVNTVIALLGAVLAVPLTVYFALRQLGIAQLSLQRDIFQELRAWADETCDALSAAIHLCDLDTETRLQRCHKIRVQLSSLRERGLWFFPNQEFGGDYRDALLDSLMNAYELAGRFLQDQPEREQLRKSLWDARNIFVIEILRVLDPRRRKQEFKIIMAKPAVEDMATPPDEGSPPPDREPLPSDHQLPPPDMPPPIVTPPSDSIPIQEMTWKAFFGKVASEHIILEPKRGSVYIINMKTRLELLKRIRTLFVINKSFQKMDVEERKEIAGLTETSGAFGAMIAAGMFRKAIGENNPHLSDALDLIPIEGNISRQQYLAYIVEFLEAFPRPRGGGGIATATRLLAMKRPDIFVCVNGGGPKLGPAFGARPMPRFEEYWDKIIEGMRKTPWYCSSEPSPGDEREVWKARAAFLDSIFYEG